MTPDGRAVTCAVIRLVDAVFDYPTLAESYKVAALDAVNKLRRVARISD